MDEMMETKNKRDVRARREEDEQVVAIFCLSMTMVMGILSRLPIRNLSVLRVVGHHHEIPSSNYSTKRFSKREEKKTIEQRLEEHNKYGHAYREGFAVRLMNHEARKDCIDAVQVVQQVFDLLPKYGCPRTVRSFNALLQAYLKFEKYDELKNLFRQLPSQLSITPNVHSYNLMIKGLREMGSLDSALEMFDEMEKKKGLKPDLATFNALLSGFYDSGRLSDGERIWSMMEERNIKPDTGSYNAKLRGMAMIEGKSCEAVKLVEELESSGEGELNSDSYHALLKGLCRDGNMDKVMRIYREFREREDDEFAPAAYITCETHETLIHGAYDNGDLDAALEICLDYPVWHMEDRRVVQAVVDALVDNSREEDAKALVERSWSEHRRKNILKMPTSSKGRQLAEKTKEIDQVQVN